MYNNHYAQTGTTTYITSNSIFRWRLRSDIWGYFNFVSGTFPDAMVSSTIEAVATPGKTELVMIIPMTATEEVETLVVPISGALGSWGGVFSLVTTVYHLLFGVGKMSPFGYIQQFLMRSGTKRMIKKDYADEDKCLLGTRDTKEKGQHTHYPHKPPTEVAPFGDAPAYQMLDQEDSSRSNVQAEDINVTQILKQLQEQQEKLQEQQEKLALLHTAYEDVLQRLEEHEAKSRHSEHLIKGFYLDMEMIDEALESPETIQSTSINTAHRL
ncbi:MAG: hypothetical protein J3Q66DRAFT_319 [Benniella sp.]|nr:MAG: hypothetical protein J3Q66DRAFT_319 [Benniella sp.]